MKNAILAATNQNFQLQFSIRTRILKRYTNISFFFWGGGGAKPIKFVNRPLSKYASVPANNNLKSRLRAKFLYICCIFSHEASTSGYCSRELKRNSKVIYF